jgi:hypothetical protein
MRVTTLEQIHRLLSHLILKNFTINYKHFRFHCEQITTTLHIIMNSFLSKSQCACRPYLFTLRGLSFSWQWRYRCWSSEFKMEHTASIFSPEIFKPRRPTTRRHIGYSSELRATALLLKYWWKYCVVKMNKSAIHAPARLTFLRIND